MSELAGLLDGLATFDKALGSHIDQGIREEQAAGRRARATGQAQPDDASEDFARGYMAMDMSVKGDQDGAAMVQSYESSFDPDKDNFDDWLAKQYGERAYGLDGPFREHYDTTFIKHVEKVRTAHAQAEGARVREKVESNALYVLDSFVRNMAESGEALNGPLLADLQNSMKKLGVSGERFQELLFAAVKKYGDEGRPSVYQALKENRPDGSPGMYFSPEWKAKIDAAEEAATRTYVSGRKAVEEGMRKERDQRQEEEVARIMLMDDPREARSSFDTLLRTGLITRASDIDKFQRLLEGRIKRDATPEQEAAESGLLVRIYRGEVGPMDILRAAGDGGISPAGRKSLLSEWYRVKNDQRQAAAREGAADSKQWNSPMARLALQSIRGVRSLALVELPEDQTNARKVRLALEAEMLRALQAGEIAAGQEVKYANELVKQAGPLLQPTYGPDHKDRMEQVRKAGPDRLRKDYPDWVVEQLQRQLSEAEERNASPGGAEAREEEATGKAAAEAAKGPGFLQRAYNGVSGIAADVSDLIRRPSRAPWVPFEERSSGEANAAVSAASSVARRTSRGRIGGQDQMPTAAELRQMFEGKPAGELQEWLRQRGFTPEQLGETALRDLNSVLKP
ncbi:MAG: hypothetical protein IV112_02475 [Methyloversatilis discipulorum]|uniref:hypothetical protein n=1 Tax=Methyloversatilis discipulorum TaxID=1119528 RepID=UPI0026EACEE5|nr:hypothetical protein [Methyloversatilis discipulorum]MBT9515528.1 hypothetical protein [Methyloversatilis discipulorum]